MYGYLLGFLFSAVISGIAVYFAFVMLIAVGLRSGSNSILPALPVLGGYLLAVFLVSVLARQIFNSNLWLAFAINVSSVFFVIFLIFVLNLSGKYTLKRKQAHNAQTAINEAPYVHLQAPFVKKVQKPNGGVALYLHVPFTVERTVYARSVLFLAPIQPERDVKFSSNPSCNRHYESPPYGFHIVDREYTESALPPHVTGTKMVAEQLEPDKTYFLLRELYFTNSICKISDYDEFDVKQFKIMLDISRAEQNL